MVQGLVAEGTDGCLQCCFSAFMMRSQIAVGGSGEGKAAASAYRLLEKYVRKYKVKIDQRLVGPWGQEGRSEYISGGGMGR